MKINGYTFFNYAYFMKKTTITINEVRTFSKIK